MPYLAIFVAKVIRVVIFTSKRLVLIKVKYIFVFDNFSYSSPARTPASELQLATERWIGTAVFPRTPPSSYCWGMKRWKSFARRRRSPPPRRGARSRSRLTGAARADSYSCKKRGVAETLFIAHQETKQILLLSRAAAHHVPRSIALFHDPPETHLSISPQASCHYVYTVWTSLLPIAWAYLNFHPDALNNLSHYLLTPDTLELPPDW